MTYHHVAFRLHARSIDAHETLIDLLTQIISPALLTELMVTGESEAIAFIKLAKADNTVAAMLIWAR